MKDLCFQVNTFGMHIVPFNDVRSGILLERKLFSEMCKESFRILPRRFPPVFCPARIGHSCYGGKVRSGRICELAQAAGKRGPQRQERNSLAERVRELERDNARLIRGAGLVT